MTANVALFAVSIAVVVGAFAPSSLLFALRVADGSTPQLRALRPVEAISYRGRLVRDWIAAVLRHTPGENDDALTVVRRWSAEDLRDAWDSANIMVALLEDPTRRRFYAQQKGAMVDVEIRSADLNTLAMKAEELLQRPGRNAFLKRAALLHTDAALLAGTGRPRAPFNSSFLLPDRVFVNTGDGVQGAFYGGDVNFEFGRILLDGVANVAEDADVREWYAASLAYMVAIEHLDNPHFEHALRLLPRSPEILFFNGCLHESLADARVQAVVDEIRVPAHTALDVKSQRWELGEAERLFRSAIDIKPDHYEARLRYGRTRARMERSGAASELRAALAGLREPVLKYYASLFLGAEEEAVSRTGEARAWYEQAATLFPRAQTPRLALSQLLHRGGDRVGARAALTETLNAPRRGEGDDPWWRYAVSCGRNAGQRMSYVYRSVAGGSR